MKNGRFSDTPSTLHILWGYKSLPEETVEEGDEVYDEQNEVECSSDVRFDIVVSVSKHFSGGDWISFYGL